MAKTLLVYISFEDSKVKTIIGIVTQIDIYKDIDTEIVIYTYRQTQIHIEIKMDIEIDKEIEIVIEIETEIDIEKDIEIDIEINIETYTQR